MQNIPCELEEFDRPHVRFSVLTPRPFGVRETQPESIRIERSINHGEDTKWIRRACFLFSSKMRLVRCEWGRKKCKEDGKKFGKTKFMILSGPWRIDCRLLICDGCGFPRHFPCGPGERGVHEITTVIILNFFFFASVRPHGYRSPGPT